MQHRLSPLEYAPPSPLTRRRRMGLAALLGLLICLALAAMHRGPEGWRRARVAYWQRQCLHYTAPPDQVVYDQDPATAPALAARGGGYSAMPRAQTPTAVFEPPRLAALRQVAPSVPAALPVGEGGVLFLHERQSPSGMRRLVLVRNVPWTTLPSPQFLNGFDVDAYVIEPGKWGTNPIDRTVYESDVADVMVIQVLPRLRIFAGQVDPADPAHFTIRYELEGRSHRADGWLRDDGRVEFKTDAP